MLGLLAVLWWFVCGLFVVGRWLLFTLFRASVLMCCWVAWFLFVSLFVGWFDAYFGGFNSGAAMNLLFLLGYC